MPRFITGDELGNIKVLRYEQNADPKTSLKTLKSSETPNPVQALASSSGTIHEGKVAAAHANGDLFAYSLNEDDELEIVSQWKEERLVNKAGQSFVGIAIHDQSVYTCTSNGPLRYRSIAQDEASASSSSSSQIATLPTRLRSWQLSPDHHHFAYAGDEVELSVWDAQKAFETTASVQEMMASNAASKKRKRNDALFEGEVWRAKNVANDNLGLRQPVRISTHSYITPSSSSNNLLITGTEFGNVRRYDTRVAGRRPTSDWSGFTQGNGIKKIQCGLREHEAFIADTVNGLHALDLRNGKVIYKYKGLSGTVSSIAASPDFLASASMDRHCRIHSTVAPPPEAKNNGSGLKGEVLEKVYVTSTPTVIVWDGQEDQNVGVDGEEEEDEWEKMQTVQEGDESRKRRKV